MHSELQTHSGKHRIVSFSQMPRPLAQKAIGDMRLHCPSDIAFICASTASPIQASDSREDWWRNARCLPPPN